MRHLNRPRNGLFKSRNRKRGLGSFITAAVSKTRDGCFKLPISKRVWVNFGSDHKMYHLTSPQNVYFESSDWKLSLGYFAGVAFQKTRDSCLKLAIFEAGLG